MGIRESLNQNPAVTTGVTIGIIVLALIIILYQAFGGGGPTGGSSGGGGKLFFTDDDGKNYFADDASKIPPFDHGGKTAVRAYVFSCNGKQFVSYLERYNADAKKKMEAAKAAGKDTVAMQSIQMGGMEVKRPGDKDWVSQTDPRAVKVVQPQCPGGGQLELVSP